MACPEMLLLNLVFGRPEPGVAGTCSHWLTEPIVKSFKKLPATYQTTWCLKWTTVSIYTEHWQTLQSRFSLRVCC